LYGSVTAQISDDLNRR